MGYQNLTRNEINRTNQLPSKFKIKISKKIKKEERKLYYQNKKLLIRDATKVLANTNYHYRLNALKQSFCPANPTEIQLDQQTKPEKQKDSFSFRTQSDKTLAK